MARRVSLPAADDLFRPTIAPDAGADPAEGKPQGSVRAVPDAAPETEAPKKGASGRVKHDEKVTVYVTAEELLDLERTRLELRAEHGISADRGRIIREAIDAVLADFHENGEDSMLVRGLLER
ncbi:hypothetical protein [Nocardioides sp. GXZ039]|uniref:hypothetical protein n=1 Tax=Nocardioides sp. GXZ039 TaxID=3136018 RepID=UPI0030F36F8E